MIYLNKRALNSEKFSIFEKIRMLGSLEHYLAENVSDYLENSKKIQIPFYKKIYAGNPAIICIRNVGIDLIKFDGKDEGYFSIHDHTGKDTVFWGDCDLVEPAISFSQAEKIQGLKEKDWIYSVSLCYFTGFNSPSYIMNVEKNKFSRLNKKKSASSLIEKLLPEFQPVIQPSY